MDALDACRLARAFIRGAPFAAAAASSRLIHPWRPLESSLGQASTPPNRPFGRAPAPQHTFRCLRRRAQRGTFDLAVPPQTGRLAASSQVQPLCCRRRALAAPRQWERNRRTWTLLMPAASRAHSSVAPRLRPPLRRRASFIRGAPFAASRASHHGFCDGVACRREARLHGWYQINARQRM